MLFAHRAKGVGFSVNRYAAVRGANTLSRPLMGYVEKSILRNYLHDSTAIDPHRKHDPLKPSLYFIVDLFNRDTDESSGQVAQKLRETNC